MPPAAAEYGVTRHYLDWILSLPWEKETEDKIDLTEAERILNEQHFGLTKVKDRLLEFLAVIKRRKQIKGPILCLVGPPGVGKTSLGRSVADALGRKFARISLGGMRDEAEIRGHRRTYVGALPGRIIQTLRRDRKPQPGDSAGRTGQGRRGFSRRPGGGVARSAGPGAEQHLHRSLPGFARSTCRACCSSPRPTGSTRFIPRCATGWKSSSCPATPSRRNCRSPSRYLVPRQLEEHGLTRKSEVRIPDATIRRVIHDYTREAGVRQLEREIAALTPQGHSQDRQQRPHAQTAGARSRDALKDYLGAARFISETAETIKEIGIATGMAWTPVGGEVLFIEATRMPGKGSLLLTGSLGDVMKESAQTALSYLRSQAKALGVDMAITASTTSTFTCPPARRRRTARARA